MVKIAIFGGSFDPPHFGHKKIIDKALEILDIDRVIVVPTYLNPFKSSSSATADNRFIWAKKVFDNDRVTISDFEIKQNRVVYTSQTVEYFKMFYNVKFVIIGADNLASLNKWYNFEYLNSSITWVIASRDSIKIDTTLLKRWVRLDVEADISSSFIRENLNFDGVDSKIKDDIKKVYN
ncbi:Nicotinate-nucleotide adenylyltransferase [hydrothermal vent metagenome]|uniref:Nicotinate-nucleotide adenylyltransferase n=1 Tax=hydrothermal vent metagenome TaxID=652676 RepID=A0A1W1EKL3_9ZZZZ